MNLRTYLSAVQTRMCLLEQNYPLVWKELSSVLTGLDEARQQYLQILYAGLDCHDIPSVKPQEMLRDVNASQKASGLLSYTSKVPFDLFCSYVLPPRVNNEWLDGSREWLFDALYPRVKDLDLLEAALEVNYWCCEKATYQPTDDRTIAPMGMCRRAYGRCGEESTLLVCALRAVGIPARQCYAPYWAHCDDNHAWVEFWAGDGWHYMGACEPEPVEDLGWFQAAASKAMLVRSRVPNPEIEEGYSIVNTTSNYAKTAVLHVCVTAQDRPVAGAVVDFQLINYSRIQTLYSGKTDTAGRICMETGLGSLLVSTCLDGVYVEQIVDLKQVQSVILRREDGIDPIRSDYIRSYVLNVPKETIPSPAPSCPWHLEKLHNCEDERKRYESQFSSASPWLKKARGNAVEIERFLALDDYSMSDKELLLETLPDKDFCDCTCQVLESYLRSAITWKHQYPVDVWQQEILAPRVEHEMLLNIRPELEMLLSRHTLTTQRQVLTWMEQNLRKDPEYGLTDRRGDAAGYIRNRCCPESEWNILAVQICRALGIPASLSPQTGRLSDRAEQRNVTLTLKSCSQPMTEDRNFSLSRWTGKAWTPIRLNGSTILDELAVPLGKGAYCLVIVRRQIDGSIDAAIHRFPLLEDREILLIPQPDHTADKLISVPLPPISMSVLTENGANIASQCAKAPSLLIFLEPGKEPTEHLLREILELRSAYLNASVPIRFLLNDPKQLEDPTLSIVLKNIPTSAVFLYDTDQRFSVQAASGIGDGRLPLALVVNNAQRILYGCANYNIGTAAALLNILSMAP